MRMFKNCKDDLGVGYTSKIEFELNGEALTIRPVKRDKMIKLRELDSWGLAVYKNLSAKQEIKQLIFKANSSDYDEDQKIESLKRRLSFLNQNNSFMISLYLDEKEVSLYSYEDFEKKSTEEIVRSEIDDRKDYQYSGNPEKDLQKFLSDGESNERLAIFGSDFENVKNALIREFPTGTYHDQVSEETRITQTDYIDFVTVNNRNELSLVELKINNNSLDVISQALNYSLFFLIHKEKLKKILKNKNIEYKGDGVPFNTYIVNNKFHPKFDDIFEFYSPKETEKYFKLIKNTMEYPQCFLPFIKRWQK